MVELGRVALDDAALLEPAHPLVDGRGRHAQGLAEVGVADPAVLGEEVDDATVEVFHGVSSSPGGARTARTARPVGVGRRGRLLSGHAADRLMLLDSASLYFRAFFGVPDQRSTPDETPTNALRGFLDMIATLVTAHRPDAPRRVLGRRLAPAVAGRPRADVQDAPAHRGLRRRRGEPRRPHPAGAAHPRGAARRRHPPARRAGVRGRRRHRHADRAAPRRDAGRRRHRRPRPAPARRRRQRHPGALHRQGRGPRPRRRDPVATSCERYAVAHRRGVPRHVGAARRHQRRAAGGQGHRRQDGRPAHRDLRLPRRAARRRRRRRPGLKGARRTNLEAASAYLDVAPTVVRVARDAPVADVDLRAAARGGRPGPAGGPRTTLRRGQPVPALTALGRTAWSLTTPLGLYA